MPQAEGVVQGGSQEFWKGGAKDPFYELLVGWPTGDYSFCMHTGGHHTFRRGA